MRTDKQGGMRLGTAKQPGLEALTGPFPLLSWVLAQIAKAEGQTAAFLDSLGFRLYQGEHKLK